MLFNKKCNVCRRSVRRFIGCEYCKLDRTIQGLRNQCYRLSGMVIGGMVYTQNNAGFVLVKDENGVYYCDGIVNKV